VVGGDLEVEKMQDSAEKDSMAEREGFEPSIELFNPITV
jgi:hypothetical protein